MRALIVLGLIPLALSLSHAQRTETPDGVSIEIVPRTPDRRAEPHPDAIVPDAVEPTVDYEALRRRVIYPAEALRLGIEGRVIVRALIDVNGNAVRTRIEHSDDSLLDAAAIDAVMATDFTPATLNGEPIALWVSIPIDFRIEESQRESDGGVTEGGVNIPGVNCRDEVPPVYEQSELDSLVAAALVAGEFPPGDPDGDDTVELRVLIDERGVPLTVRVERSAGDLRDDVAVRAALRVHFTPGTCGGKPASPWVTVPVVFAGVGADGGRR